jgi:hypothetical protein
LPVKTIVVGSVSGYLKNHEPFSNITTMIPINVMPLRKIHDRLHSLHCKKICN